MAAPRWKDNAFKKFVPKDGTLPTKEEWRTWGIQVNNKLEAMGDEWFVDAAEALTLVEDEFHQLIAHPVPDVFLPTPNAAFKVAVVNIAVLHGILFPVAADNVNPTAPVAKLNSNYANIIARVKAINSQLSDTCSEAMETIFLTERCIRHPVKGMLIWKRITDSFHKILVKDRGKLM